MANTAAKFVDNKVEFGWYSSNPDTVNEFVPDTKAYIQSIDEGHITVDTDRLTVTGDLYVQKDAIYTGDVSVVGSLDATAKEALKWVTPRTLTYKVGNSTIAAIATDGTANVEAQVALLEYEKIRCADGTTSGNVYTPDLGIYPGSSTSTLGTAEKMYANTHSTTFTGQHFTNVADNKSELVFTDDDTLEIKSKGFLVAKIASNKSATNVNEATFPIKFYRNVQLDNSSVLTASKVFNAWYNDIADFFDVEAGLPIVAGRAYVYDGKHGLSKKKAEKGSIGICSDTYGVGVGQKEGVHQLPIAVGGIVLAFTDKEYLPGTALVAGKDGILTKAPLWVRLAAPERILATMYRKETAMVWKDVKVNGRVWVKVK